MNKITHYFKKNLGICMAVITVVFLVPMVIHAAGTTVNTTIKFTPVTVSKTGTGTATATTTITYVNSSKTNTTAVPGTSIDAVLYKKNMFGFTTELVRTNITTVAAKYNIAASVSAKFINLDESQEYWITFNEKDFPTTVVKSANFTLEAKTLKFGGGKFGGAGALGSWTEGTTTQTPNTTIPPVPPVPPKTTTPKPTNVPKDAEPVAPTSYELEFRFLPDAWLQTLKAKGSVKFVGTGSGTLGGTITLTPVAYNGTKLPAETFTLPSTSVEAGGTYPLEFTFKQKLPIGVSISKFEINSSNASVESKITTPSTGLTDVVTGSDGKKTTFSITKADYDASKKTIALVGSISYTDDFVATNKYNKILADIYSGNTKISTKNLIFTKTTTGKLDFNSVISDIDVSKNPDSFKIRDTSAEVTSKSFSLSTGTNQTGNLPQTSGLIRFSAKSTTYTGTKIDGSITPTVQGSDLKIKGELTYSKIAGNPATADVKNAGRMSFHLIDGENKVSQIKVDQLADGVSLEYDIPYQFEVTFPNYNRYLDQEGVPTNLTVRPVPFKVQIIEDQLSAKTEALTVVTTQQNSNQNNQNADAQTDSISVQNGPAAGTKVDFNVTPYYKESTSQAWADASITYHFPDKSKNYSGGTTVFNLYDKDNKLVGTKTFGSLQVLVDDYPYKFNASTLIFDNASASKAPFTLKVLEKDLNATSKAFSVNKTSGNPGDTNNPDNPNNPDGSSQPGVSLNRISLANPLKDGLDSIPAIVAVLVKDIVIPIAVPFLALAIIYTGFLFVQARGNTDKLKEAKASLKWTLIGGAVILGAYVIATALQATIADIVR